MLLLSSLVYQNRTLKFTPHFFIRPIKTIDSVGGHLYTAPSDEPTPLSPSELMTAQMLENGAAITITASLREQVRLSGKGRYFLTDREVGFSSSDNTDPRTNGRTYSFRYALITPGWLAALIYILTLLLAVSALSISIAGTSLSSRLWAGLRRITPFLPIILVNLVLISILLLCLELAFARLYPFLNFTKKTTVRYVDRVGFTFEPQSVASETNYLEFGATSTANSLGFLDREPMAPVSTECHVAIIGDSFVEAAQVSTAEKVQRLLEKSAQERFPDWRLRTSAFGFRGTGQLNQLPFYQLYARNYRPRLVVLVFVSNDFADNSPIISSLRTGTHPDFPLWTSARRTDQGMRIIESDVRWRDNIVDISGTHRATINPLHHLLREKSGLYKWLWLRLSLKYDLVAGLEPRPRDSVRARADLFRRDPRTEPLMSAWDDRYATNLDGEFNSMTLDPLYQEAYEFTRFGLEQFKQQTTNDGAKLVILVASQVRSLNSVVYAKVEELGREVGIPVIDQYDFIVRHGGDPRRALYQFDMHWTPEGHRWAAEALLEYLDRTGACHSAALSAGGRLVNQAER